MPDYGRGKRPITEPAAHERQMRADRDAIRAALDKLTDRMLRTMAERGERVVRGSVEGERVGSGKGTVPEPTARVALEGLPNDDETPDQWRERADSVGKCIAQMAALMHEMVPTMEAVEDKMNYVLGVKVDEFAHLGSHKTAGTCRACERKVTGSADDRLREGYCDSCRQAWKRAQESWIGPGAPDRLAFERERAAKAEREKREAS